MAEKKDGRKLPRKPRFQEGDRVLCFHGPFLYKAECTKVSVKYKKVKYQVRYFGVKRRSSVKGGLKHAEQLSSLEAPDACQPSTSDTARDTVEFADAGADGWDVCVALKGRPSPQADWEDEWLPQSKLLKYSKENLRKLRELNRAQQGQAAERSGAGPITREKASALQRKNDRASGVKKAKIERRQITRDTEPPVPKVPKAKTGRGRGRPPGPGRRRKGLLLPRKKQVPVTSAAHSDSDSDSDSTPNPDFLKKAATKVPIPEVLKPWLLDDWDMIVKQNQLFHLPAKKNIDSILEDYVRYETVFENVDDKWMAQIREVVIGIKAYFNVMLGSQLLYKYERPQYAEILANLPGVPMSQIYGAPHLLRLFVKVEDMLVYTPLEDQTLVLLLQHFQRVLDYLANNFSVLFNSKEYDITTPEYHRQTF